MGNVSGSVALNWVPTLKLFIAPVRFAERFTLDFVAPPLLQPASARVAAPVATSISRRVIWYMELSLLCLSCERALCLPLDRAERDPGDEVPLDEGVDH